MRSTYALQNFTTTVLSSINSHAQTEQELGVTWRWDQGLTVSSSGFEPAERPTMLAVLQNNEDSCRQWQMIKQSCNAQMVNIMDILANQPEFLNQMPNPLLVTSPGISEIVPILRVILAIDYEMNAQLPSSLRNSRASTSHGRDCISINLSPTSSSASSSATVGARRKYYIYLDPSHDQYAATLCKILSNHPFPSAHASEDVNNIPGVRLGSILSNTIEPLGIESIDNLLTENFPILMAIQKATRDLQDETYPDFASNSRYQLSSIQGKIRTINHVLTWIMDSIEANDLQASSLDPHIAREDAVDMLSELVPVIEQIKADLNLFRPRVANEGDPLRADGGASSDISSLLSDDLFQSHIDWLDEKIAIAQAHQPSISEPLQSSLRELQALGSDTPHASDGSANQQQQISSIIDQITSIFLQQQSETSRLRLGLDRVSIDLHSERARAQNDRSQASLQGTQAQNERNQLQAERDQVIRQRNQLQAERDRVIRQRNQLQAERDQVIRQRNQLQAEIDRVIRQRNQASSERDQAINEGDQARDERDQAKAQLHLYALPFFVLAACTSAFCIGAGATLLTCSMIIPGIALLITSIASAYLASKAWHHISFRRNLGVKDNFRPTDTTSSWSFNFFGTKRTSRPNPCSQNFKYDSDYDYRYTK